MKSEVDIPAIRRNITAPLLLLSTYVAILAFSASTFPGDTRDYANSIAAHFVGRDLYFWEFGHLLWRPFGYLTAAISAQLGLAEPSRYLAGVRALTSLSILAGAVALVAFLGWLVRLGFRRSTAFVTTVAMALTSAFLNYSQTGAAYVSALAMLCVALWATARADDASTPRVALPALALSMSILFWLPMVLAVPAACLSPVILRGDSASRRAMSCRIAAFTALFVGCAYGVVILAKGIYTYSALSQWMSAASHGIRDSGGVARAAVGFARSVVSNDRLGIIAKRYLLHDPLNPATLGDVVRGGLYRLALFYVAAAVIAVMLVRNAPSHRALIFLMISATPVLTLALLWQGGDLERYLPLFPALFLTVAAALALLPYPTRLITGAALCAGLLALNMPEYLRGRSELACAQLSRRLSAIPANIRTRALVVTPLNSDDWPRARGLCPELSLDDARNPSVIGLVTPHELSAPSWRRFFAVRAMHAWQSGKRVFISRRALAARPAAAWEWVEGDEPRIHWRDFPTFFRSLQHNEFGGADGELVEIPPSPINVASLERLAGNRQ